MFVTVIPAKGHSKRLPNKNMSIINGRPMIDYTIDEALRSCSSKVIYVSTDSDIIANHAEERGLNIIRRSESLGGEVPVLEVYRDALAKMPESKIVSVLVGLQPDHPDRYVSVDETLKILLDASADRVMSKDAEGIKNGAHYVLTRNFINSGKSRKDIIIVDDCTNIHHAEDLERAAKRLAMRK